MFLLINTLRARAFGQQPGSIVEANIRNLYFEILFAATLGAIITYNALFVVRLGASTALVGILSAAPALVVALTSIPSARYLERKIHRKAWMINSLLFMRLGYLVVVALPLFVPLNVAAVLLVLWLIILNVPNAFFTNGFNAMLADLIPAQRRAFVFSRRAIIWSLAIVVALTFAGRWLDTASFPMNYQVLYLVGVIIAMGSQFFLMRLQVPDAVVVARPVTKLVVPPIKLSRPMINILVNSFVYQLGLQLSGPLFVIYYTGTLKVTDGMISLNTAAGTLGVVFGLILWEAVLRKRSYTWVLRAATLGTWMFPFTLAFSHNFTLIIVANFVVNLLHPAVDLSTLNVMLNLSKPEERNVNMSYYTTVVNISMFIGPLAAVPLSIWIGIPGVMLIAAILRICGGVLFQINRVPETTN